jgi:hypothetical protein
MEEEYISHSSEFFCTPPHSMIVSQAGTQFSIRISPDALVGTDFHSEYNELLAQRNERDENGLPKHFLLDIYKALKQLVWKTCKSVSETSLHANPEPSTPPERSLQDYIQPPTLHLTLAKNAHSSNGVAAKIVGDSSSNEYPWLTSRTAQTARHLHLTNTYSFDTAPVPTQDLLPLLGPAAVQTFAASELFVTRKWTTEAGPMQMQQVHTLTESHCFFKPRLDLKAPEFDREVAVLGAVRRSGLDRKLRVSPFKGLVLLDNGLVAGMLFEWLEGSPLAEHPSLSDPSYHKRWQEQVEGVVKELHRHEIVWGDVNVHNIFIDANADAWVTDFGGNCNVEFVDEELKETYEGDLQGLRRVFEEWLPVAGKRAVT